MTPLKICLFILYRVSNSTFNIHNSEFIIAKPQFKIQNLTFNIHNSEFIIAKRQFKIQHSKLNIQNSHLHYLSLRRRHIVFVHLTNLLSCSIACYLTAHYGSLHLSHGQ